MTLTMGGSKSWFILLFLMFVTVHSHGLNPEKEANNQASKQVVIQVDKIKKALWDSGFKIMSLMMDRNLRLIRAKVEFNNNGTVTLYNHTAITMFIPQDDGIHFRGDKTTSFELQIVTSKIDKKAFDSGFLSKGSVLGNLHTGPPRNRRYGNLVVRGPGEINIADITHWDIYNDGKVVVHGVNSFFQLYNPWKFPLVRIATPDY